MFYWGGGVRDSVSCSVRGTVLLGRCPKPCKGRRPLTPPKDEALGNPAFAQKIRLNGMKALLSSPSAVFFELVGVMCVLFLCASILSF
ncbi:hypothetical protein SAMN02745702_00770 [Desulfobaculum bizertense DSM 18034]|uniref:Uncharacterized protein n=1 Tax=Desulfobaculum bizertense DSM 18034 TaxID=1121442 RepID=A0A1T4VQL2_9BACT|nr:hypothetical protein SAMN02745702_00770 [Desulfobaculum bizertense DSM 18034]